jgi:hypothetical protein
MAPLLTAREAAERLRVDRATVYRRMRLYLPEQAPGEEDA